MKYFIKSLIVVVVGSLVLANASYAADVAVIVNSSNPEALSIEQIKNIYSDRVTTWRSGKRIVVYNLPNSSESAEVFAQNVLGISAQSAKKAIANRKITNSLNNPPKTKRERLIVALVSRKINAIGYVPVYLVKDEERVRVVAVIKDK